jgi:hypothetical protein
MLQIEKPPGLGAAEGLPGWQLRVFQWPVLISGLLATCQGVSDWRLPSVGLTGMSPRLLALLRISLRIH